MKKTLIYFLCAVMFGCVYSCSTDELIPQITLPADSPDYFKANIDFDSHASEQTITFDSNVAWTVSVDETRDGSEWCTVSPNSGEPGVSTVTISVKENTTYDDRSAVVRLVYGDSIKNIFVNQKQLDALTLTSDRFEVPVSGGEVKVEVKSNIDFNVNIPDECKTWIHQKTSSTRALNTTNLIFKVDASTEYDKRVGRIEITSGDKKEEVMIYQVGEGILTLTKKIFNISNAEQNLQIEVNSNFEYSIDMPQVDWISENKSSTKSVSTHTINLHIKENTSYDDRSASLVIYDKNSDISEEVIINQSQVNVLQLEEKEFIFDENGGEFMVNISSNLDYKITINDDWIREEKINTRALVATSYKFTVDEMSEGTERESIIIISDKESGITDEVVVKQINTFYINNSYVEMMVDGSLQLILTNNTDQDVIWESSDDSIVTVDGSGNLKAIARGVANIKVATVDGKHKRECVVEVKDITDYITVYCGGGSIMSNNGLILYGSSLNWFFINGSNSYVKLLSLQLVDGQTGDMGNEMNVDADVAPGERVGYSVRIGYAGIHAPVTCRYKYEYNGKIYTSKAVYSN